MTAACEQAASVDDIVIGYGAVVARREGGWVAPGGEVIWSKQRAQQLARQINRAFERAGKRPGDRAGRVPA